METSTTMITIKIPQTSNAMANSDPSELLRANKLIVDLGSDSVSETVSQATVIKSYRYNYDLLLPVYYPSTWIRGTFAAVDSLPLPL